MPLPAPSGESSSRNELIATQQPSSYRLVGAAGKPPEIVSRRGLGAGAIARSRARLDQAARGFGRERPRRRGLQIGIEPAGRFGVVALTERQPAEPERSHLRGADGGKPPPEGQ